MNMERDNQFWEWVEQHAASDPHTLWIKYGKTHADAIVQVECRRKFGKKLAATLQRVPRWYFPSVLAGEQSTSDALAAFHARLVPEFARMADMTAGLGIDAVHCAAVANHVTAIEIDAAKADSLRENAAAAGIENIEVVNVDCRDWLKNYSGPKLDIIFMDPARRATDGSRVYGIADCEPDLLQMLPELREKTHTLLVKLSPMLDVAAVLDALPDCVRLIALGTPTECRELLAYIDFEHPAASRDAVVVDAITIGADLRSEFRCTRAEEQVADAVYGRPRVGDWVCEPYPAVMKVGAVRLVSERYRLQKLAPNTHVYFAPERLDHFPGEQRRVAEVLPYASKVIKRFARRWPRINVAARNFGISADALRAKLSVADGGNLRLLAVTDLANERILLVLE